MFSLILMYSFLEFSIAVYRCAFFNTICYMIIPLIFIIFEYGKGNLIFLIFYINSIFWFERDWVFNFVVLSLHFSRNLWFEIQYLLFEGNCTTMSLFLLDDNFSELGEFWMEGFVKFIHKIILMPPWFII